ncbi:MAG: hypothetical protein EP305_08635 [Bacteroidetes bacterium]|nr:MAG: hypothetical protein EP305_08635 [Bacteroidota bacterium]
MRPALLTLFIFCYAYSILRYHVGAEIPLQEWIFILNKSIAWTGFTCIGLSLLPATLIERMRLTKRIAGIYGFSFSGVHIIVSFCLLYDGNLLIWKKLESEDFMFYSFIVSGALSFLIYLFPLVATLKDLPSTAKMFKIAKLGYLVNILHPFLLGYSGWGSLSKWPLFMPPITLLAVLSAMVFFGFNLSTKRS